ncbi:uncharacterized protein DS421_2g51090 [Arachis hypogaea]|nr:uncharacterized protein DS421_2g51090 [Arachis hypogaea]
MEVNHLDALLAQNKLITQQLATLTKHMEEAHVSSINTQAQTQTIREGANLEEECEWEQANFVGNSSRQPYDPHAKINNPGWKNHPNFGWKGQQNQN